MLAEWPLPGPSSGQRAEVSVISSIQTSLSIDKTIFILVHILVNIKIVIGVGKCWFYADPLVSGLALVE